MTTLISPGQTPAAGWNPSRFLPRWIGANAAAEALGLGGSALLTMGVFSRIDAASGILLQGLVVVIASTLLEGTAVGLAQWLVLRPVLPRLSRNSWWLATMAGALIAWLLGMLPSTMMNMQEAAGSSAGSAPPMEEPAAWVIYLLAAGMGLVLGPVLAGAQWMVLRRHVARAWIWLPANALAWAAGMVLIFWGVGFAADRAVLDLTTIAIVVSILFAAGAAVGAVHGAFLIRLLQTAER